MQLCSFVDFPFYTLLVETPETSDQMHIIKLINELMQHKYHHLKQMSYKDPRCLYFMEGRDIKIKYLRLYSNLNMSRLKLSKRAPNAF